jgi:succinate dehydrogenase / fumarate reductase, iron-sulfur subunit
VNLTLRIRRQQSANAPGRFANYQVKDAIPDMSFVEMLDALNDFSGSAIIDQRLDR